MTGVAKMPDLSTDTARSNQHEEMKRAVIKNALILAVFAFISTGLIAITHILTKDKIAQEIELALVRQLSQIVPAENYTNDVYKDCIVINNIDFLGTDEDQKLYRMRNAEDDYAVLLTSVAPDGYSGKIHLAVAISQQGKILGVNILSHQETPGLGDKIERIKSNWLQQFEGMSSTNPEEKQWKVKKDGGQFDALTGATITPRAVIKTVYKSLVFYQTKNKSLFETNSNCEKSND